ncbi:unnamed protein product [Miscanthus lutarioriparius]|uniref:Cytochrome P450 n=1 Tax=Miscanthus lutarioriparius TaxID=422564 RepID=A0A811Q9L6_9POAL|nr:unnamed protein product [Miscanthus lutarioriparius]
MEEFGMPQCYGCYALCIFLVFLVHAVVRAKFGASKKLGPKLPPGPWQLPLIGSSHCLLSRRLPHHRMRNLSLRHGQLMLLRICERLVVVVSSAEAAREVFGDTAFEQRPTSPALDELYSRHGMGIVFAPYGDHWRLLRRVLVTELLSAQRVESFRRIREQEAARLVSSLHATAAAAASPSDQLANIDERLAVFVTDLAVRAIFGDMTMPDRAALLDTLEQALEFSSLFDLRDLFPSSWLVRMLPRNSKAERNRLEVVRLMEGILRIHEERRSSGEAAAAGEQDMVDVLLRIQSEGAMGVSLTHGIIMDMLIDVFVAAIKATTSTLRWAMAELMANPTVMEKVQSEIRRVLAGQGRVREVAVRDMGYLNAVIKETLRLHPPIPLTPRFCTQDRKIQGYDVPKGTILVANVWAISRDPNYWQGQDPDKFMPERFEAEQTFNFMGSDFEFIPFGAGRRICPGIAFSQANIEFALASLLYHFDWALPKGVGPEELDMTESCGLEVRRKAELLLRPIPRIPQVDE